MTDNQLKTFTKACREPFPDSQIGKLPKKWCKQCTTYSPCNQHNVFKCEECGQKHTNGFIHLDYVGHAEITSRLIKIDPTWSWEPLAYTPEGTPKIEIRDKVAELWIKLTLNGITRIEVGSCLKNKEDVSKELVSDALRRAAMRFGIALELWSKSDSLTPEPELATPEMVADLKNLFDLVEDETLRSDMKKELVSKYGKPETITQDDWPNALNLVETMLETKSTEGFLND